MTLGEAFEVAFQMAQKEKAAEEAKEFERTLSQSDADDSSQSISSSKASLNTVWPWEEGSKRYTLHNTLINHYIHVFRFNTAVYMHDTLQFTFNTKINDNFIWFYNLPRLPLPHFVNSH